MGRPLREVVGEQIRRIREQANVRQDDVSRHARRYGLAWSRAKIGALEGGGKALSLEELVLLPLVLSDALGDARESPVQLTELIPSDSLISLTPDVSIAGRGLLGVLGGSDGPIPIRFRHLPTMHAVQSATDTRLIIDLKPSEAEAKVARRLGVPAMLVAETALRLWGCSLTEERDRTVEARGDAGSDPVRLRALRARTTRRLADRLAEQIRLDSADARPTDLDGPGVEAGAAADRHDPDVHSSSDE